MKYTYLLQGLLYTFNMFLRIPAIIAFIAVAYYATRWWANGPDCESTARIDGKVVIVTGGNTGIGKETVKNLVSRGGKVYLASRSISRGNAAASDIKAETNATDANLIVMQLDLGSTASIRNFVADFKKREKKLDILINNAGVMLVPQGKTEDGFEITFGVNHLGHFLLATLLTDMLIASKPSRVVTVSSYAHEMGSMNWDDLMYEKEFSEMATYCQSKLANVLFSNELGKRLKDSGVTTYSLHPGAIMTELQRYAANWPILGYLYTPILVLSSPFWKDIKHGAATTVCCAVDEDLAQVTGRYYSGVHEKISSNEESRSEEAASRLWNVSIDLLKLNRKDMHPLLR